MVPWASPEPEQFAYLIASKSAHILNFMHTGLDIQRKRMAIASAIPPKFATETCLLDLVLVETDCEDIWKTNLQQLNKHKE